MTTSRRIGRFSDGQQALADGPMHGRIGRFSDGQEAGPDTPDKQRIGRFSTGQELLAEGLEHVRVGSFGDREAPRTSPLSLHRGVRQSAELEAETVTS
jgi:hypothetical protein